MMPRLLRHGWVLAASVAFLAASGLPRSRAQEPVDAHIHERPILVRGPNGTGIPAMVTIPRRADRRMKPPGERYPLLVVLPGRAETQRGRAQLAWHVDYRLPEAINALHGGVLTAAQYRGMVRDSHLAAVNAQLARQPYQGIVIAAPAMPDFAASGELTGIAAWGDWLATSFLEQLRAQFEGAARTREGTGIDGVSLGGRAAIEIGLRHPEAFGAVGGIQPAVQGEAEALAALAGQGPAQRIRLLTSDDDTFRAATVELSEALRTRRIAHERMVVPGEHGYEFNRGPGSIELLRFHNTALRREPAPDAP